MSFDGFVRLRQQAADFADEMLAQHIEEASGDSPIEKLLFAALRVRAWLGASEYDNVVRLENKEHEERMLSSLTARTWPYLDTPGGPAAATMLLVRPQAEMKDRRTDFLIHALDWRDMEDLKWRRLIVECDGHDFHERTKEQVKRDRSRDRKAIMEGFDCFRFTGSEIWNDPWGCAEQITDWAVKGWGW
jgi:very-short-patch-repair endonuclease